MQDELQAEVTRQPWDQMPDEPDLWYGRFQIYLQLGPARTLKAAFQQLSGAAGAATRTPTPSWSLRANQLRWRQRAHAWDAWQRNLLALSERNLRQGLRHRRIDVMEDTLEAIRAALDSANIAEAGQELAREWLPQLRVFLRDMLVAERQEFEHGDFESDDPACAVAITADDLRAAQRALETQQQAPAAPGSFAPAAISRRKYVDYTFLVCVAEESGLALDLAALRAVRTATGLKFQRLLNPTRRKFSEALRRQRCFGHPIEYIHFAVHTSAAGIEFVDGPVDGAWLSERLEGVRVVLLACCASETIGDWLGVVPHVITLAEDIAHEDAATLTQHFWRNIGLGHEPAEALDEALTHCPPAVSEYVVRHW
jgi:hypothetical protein